jgi:hypothetical protein
MLTKTPRQTELEQIKTALERAGFVVHTGNRPDVLYIQGKDYTVTCYYSQEFGGWRQTPYDDRVCRAVAEALS